MLFPIIYMKRDKLGTKFIQNNTKKENIIFGTK